MINTFSKKTNDKIINNFKLMLHSFQADLVCLVKVVEKNKHEIILSLDKEQNSVQQKYKAFLLEILALSSPSNTEDVFISDLDNWLLNKNITDRLNHFKNLPFSSLYLSLLDTPIEGSKYYIALLNKSKKEFSDIERSLVQVFNENITLSLPVNQEIDQKFKLIFDAVPEAISFNELDSHRTVSVNKAFLKYSGYTEEELMGKSGIDLNLWENEWERLKYRELFEKDGFVDNLEATFVNKKGKVYQGLISGSVVTVSGKGHVLTIIRNIDLLKNAQINLEKSENKFRKVFDSLPDYLTLADLETLKFVDVNDYFVAESGYSKEQLLGTTGYELGMWVNEEERVEFRRLIREKGTVSNFRFKYKHPNGSHLHGLMSSKTILLDDKPFLLSSIRNIDELIITKEYLRRSEQKFKLFFQSSPDAISINRYSDEVFVEVNESFLNETQYTREELLGKSLMDFNLWVSNKDLLFFINEINENKEVSNMETQFRKKDGEILNTLISASISNIEGVPHIITIARNINEIKRVRKVLEDSESRYRRIVEKSHSSIIIINENYQIVYANKRTSDLFGYALTEIIGTDIRDLLHPNSTALVLDRYEKRQNNVPVPDVYEFQIIRKNKEVRDVETRSSVYKDIDGKVKTISQLLDITENKKALRKNRLLEEKAQNYLDIAAVMMLVLNEKGEITMINKKACHILEYEESELIGKNWFKYCVPDSVNKEALEDYKNLFKNIPILEYSEGLIVTKSRKERMIAWHNSLLHDDDGKIIGALSSGEDITEKLNNVRFINLSRAVVINWKNEEGFPVEYVSENVYKLLGYTANDLVESKVRYIDLIHPDDLPRVLQEVEKYSSKKNIQYFNHDYYRMITRNGKVKWIEDRTDIHRNSDGDIINYHGVLLDVTDKKTTEFELLEAKEKAEESDRLKSSFLANMSHEIRTPMNSIIGFSGLLEDSDVEEDEKRLFISRIKNNGQLLLSLINDIIDISKIEANQVNFHYTYIDIHEFFKGLNEIFKHQVAEKSLELVCSLPKNITEIKLHADINRLNQIMLNLLSNAIKFTSKGKIEYGSLVDGDYIQFYVKDSGIGIDKEEQKKMFNRFQQAKMVAGSNYGGTGLGLSISKGLVEQMGGEIWIESELGKGATFLFKLPLEQTSSNS